MKSAKTVRGARKKFVVTAVQGELPKTDDSAKYDTKPIEATILGWVQDNKVVRVGRFQSGERIALLLDRTNFYAEQGGQVGDTGQINNDDGSFEVEDTQRMGDAILHIGGFTEEAEYFEVGQKVKLFPNNRADTLRNHTATHLLNWALREVLGSHVEQKGSLVDAEKTRFDFTHDKTLTAEEIAEIEQLVNEKIYADQPVTPVTLPLTQAKQIPGVRAVFGEKYPDPVPCC